MTDETTADETTTDETQPAKPQPPKDKMSSSGLRPLRIWPAVALLVLMWGLRIVPGFFPETSMPVMMARFMGPLVCCGLIVLWWLFMSRASLLEKTLGLLGLLALIAITTPLADKSIRGFGTMIYVIPWGVSFFTAALIGLSGLQNAGRTWGALLAALVAFGYWDLVRTDEIWGDFRTSRSWRWEPTAEDRYLQGLAERAQTGGTDVASLAGLPLGEPEWPAFRGAQRNGIQPGIVLAEDWETQPLTEKWRVPIGPGWSSFSVAGRRLFTQEQRGAHEAVVCYDADNGEEVWAQQSPSRFWEAVGGAGPRGTPTLSEGQLFALGANGLLQCLDPISGEPVWQRDIREDAKRKPPTWGFSSSPLVTNKLVIVHAGGADDKGILAYDVEKGELRWGAAAGDHSYSSPQLSEVCGKQCILMLTNKGLTFVDPADGALLGKHDWDFNGYRVVQPLMVDGNSVLLGTAMGSGTERIAMRLSGDQLESERTWISRGISPYYNDYVAHQGHLYGFDNNIFACVDLATGKRNWKRGRYGNGQVLLLPTGNQLLVISEDGELVLLRATPEKLAELTRHQALNGRTWNHPVLVGDRLYVRNGEEAVCFEVPVLRGSDDGLRKQDEAQPSENP